MRRFGSLWLAGLVLPCGAEHGHAGSNGASGRILESRLRRQPTLSARTPPVARFGSVLAGGRHHHREGCSATCLDDNCIAADHNVVDEVLQVNAGSGAITEKEGFPPAGLKRSTDSDLDLCRGLSSPEGAHPRAVAAEKPRNE
jgi:hypothetical protein